MTFPTVTEIRIRLEPVDRDDFLDEIVRADDTGSSSQPTPRDTRVATLGA